MESVAEIWLPVVGWEGLYEVSDHGRLRSLDRTVSARAGGQRVVKGRIKRPYYRGDRSVAYGMVSLKVPGVERKRPIHVLVAEAFLGPRPEGFYCCHNDGDPRNNHVDNLRWDTPSSNSYDTVRHGKHWLQQPRAPRTHCKHGHALTPDNVMRDGRCKACASVQYKDYHRAVRRHRGKRRVSEVAPES